jgi:hypothetical protein
MLLQTNSYIVPKEKRTEHARLIKRFRALMHRLGCDDFDVCEQTGPNWVTETGGRFVQLMKFRDEAHQKAVRAAEQADPSAQDLVREFCDLVDYGYQQQQGIATTAFYRSLLSIAQSRLAGPETTATAPLIASDESADDDVPPLDLTDMPIKQTAARNGEIDD